MFSHCSVAILDTARYFHSGTPVTALQRVSEESLIQAEVRGAHPELCEVQEGDIVI